MTELDLDPRRGSILVRRGKGGRRREVGMDDWGCHTPADHPEPASAMGCALPLVEKRDIYAFVRAVAPFYDDSRTGRADRRSPGISPPGPQASIERSRNREALLSIRT